VALAGWRTFTRSTFARKTGLKDHETIPAVTATGLMDDPEQARRGWIRQFARDSSVTPGTLFFQGSIRLSLSQG